MRIGFVMEIGLGHTTFYKNLRAAVERHPDIEPTWIEITFDEPGLLGRIPKVRNDIRLRAGIQARRKVGAFVRREAPDALFFHTQMPTWLCSRYIEATPTMISLDGTLQQFASVGWAYGLPAPGRSWLDNKKAHHDQQVFRAARLVFAFSRWAANGVVAEYGTDEDRVVAISPGVDLDAWKPAGTKRGGRPLQLLFVGGDFWRKGGDLVLRWMRERAPEGCHLDVVSSDKVEPTRNTTVHSTLRANDPTLKRLYREADIFLLPTRGDLSPLVLMEAMASGIPVISTRMAAIPEMVVDGPLPPGGWLVEPGDWESFAETLSRVCEDRDRLPHIGASARMRAEHTYDGAKNLAREIELIKEVATRGRHLRPVR